MEELFYSSGKIYVVIGVAAIILTGIFAYLFWMDRKVSRMEKELKDKSSK